MKRTWLATSLVLALSILAGAPAAPARLTPASRAGGLPAVEPLSLSCGGTIYCETCAERGGHCVLGSGGSCTCQR